MLSFCCRFAYFSADQPRIGPSASFKVFPVVNGWTQSMNAVPCVVALPGGSAAKVEKKISVTELQKQELHDPAIWMLALASAVMYFRIRVTPSLQKKHREQP